MPGETASDATVTTYGGAFSIAQKSSNKTLDQAVIAKLTDAYSQKEIITTGLGYVPASNKYIGQYRSATPQYSAFTDQVLAKGASLDYPTKSDEFGNALVTGFQQLVASKSTSSKSLLESLQKKYGK
jgi:hypothetical protein